MQCGCSRPAKMNFTPQQLCCLQLRHTSFVQRSPHPFIFSFFFVFPRNIQLTPGPLQDLFPPTSSSFSFYSLEAAKIGEEQSASTPHHFCATKQKRLDEQGEKGAFQTLVTKVLVGWCKIRVQVWNGVQARKKLFKNFNDVFLDLNPKPQ